MFWIFFWVAFAAFIVFLIATRVKVLFTPYWTSITHKLIWACIICTAIFYAFNLYTQKSGGIPADWAVWGYRSCLYSLPIVAIVRLAQWIAATIGQRRVAR